MDRKVAQAGGVRWPDDTLRRYVQGDPLIREARADPPGYDAAGA